jgi:hypothetical protein
MKRRVMMGCVAAGILVAGFVPALAGGPCKTDVVSIECMVPDATSDQGRVIALLDKQCKHEGRKCRGRSECGTVYQDVACLVPGDGDPSMITIGLGCFCGGGSPPQFRPRPADPVSAEEALKLIEAIEAAEVANPAVCELPSELTAK